jgi:FMN phosphatase YigB (HAD superfamily)
MTTSKVNEWLHAAQKRQVVAFDVFDTLLHRDAGTPKDLFSLMEALGKAAPGFAQRRILAEQRAREQHPGVEVTLTQIYSGLPDAPEEEFAAELDAAVPDAEMLAFYRACRENGKKVYAISDMYLSAAQIGQLLKKCGYDFFDGIFVSSEYGVQKRSGKLFRLFLQKTGWKPRQVLFFGDDLRVDAAGAALAGIAAVHVECAQPAYPFPADEILGRACNAFLANRLPGCTSEAERIGFSVVGPLLFSFCRWLHENKGTEEKLVFLARDMALARKIYAELYPTETTGYLKISRRSLCPGVLAQGNVSLLLNLLPRENLAFGEILSFCGFERKSAPAGFDLKDCYDLRARPPVERTTAMLHALVKLYHSRAAQQNIHPDALLQEYLHQEIPDASDSVLVDIGSGGTTQNTIEQISTMRLSGRYLACDARLRRVLPADRAKSFLFDGNAAPLWYWAGQPLLEYLISEQCGATVGYCVSGKTICPSVGPSVWEAAVDQIQQGALRFAHQWKESMLRGLPMPGDKMAEPFLQLVRAPSLKDAALLGNFVLEDGNRYQLAAPRPMRYYLLHADQASVDFEQSHWKVAFLRRMFRVPAPYDRIYESIKMRRGR